MSRHPHPQYIQSTATFITIEGGGTKTTAHLFLDGGDEPIMTAKAGMCNPSTNLELSCTSVREVLAEICSAHSLPAAQVSLVFGIAGIVPSKVREPFVANFAEYAQVVPLSDGYAALVGAGGGKACGMVVAGTGCAGHRMRADGTSFQRDGWGWIAGDRGSGAWLGLRSMEYALEVRDGLQPNDALAEAQLEALGGETEAVATWLAGATPKTIAAQAKLVFEHAAAGLERADKLLDAAAGELRNLFTSLGCDDSDPLFVAGSIATALRERIGEGMPTQPQEVSDSAMTGCRLVATGVAPLEWPLAK